MLTQAHQIIQRTLHEFKGLFLRNLAHSLQMPRKLKHELPFGIACYSGGHIDRHAQSDIKDA